MMTWASVSSTKRIACNTRPPSVCRASGAAVDCTGSSCGSYRYDLVNAFLCLSTCIQLNFRSMLLHPSSTSHIKLLMKETQRHTNIERVASTLD